MTGEQAGADRGRTGPSWRVLPTFLLRRAGFPFAMLEAAASPDAAALATAAARAAADAERLRERLLTATFPAAVTRARAATATAELRQLSRARRAVGTRSPRPLSPQVRDEALREEHAAWLAAAADAARLAAELDRLDARERGRVAAALRELAGGPAVREALFTLSPAFVEALDHRPSPDGTSADREIDRRLYAFVQRLAAKNETTSFFGPVTFGRFSAVPEPRTRPEHPLGYTERRVFVTFWAAATLARAATRAAAVRRRAAVRRLPVAGVRDGVARLPGIEPLKLDGADEAILAACDGQRTVAEIARVCGLDEAAAERGLRTLERAGIVQRRCEPNSTTVAPLEDVLRQLPDVPETAAHRSTAEELLRLAGTYGASALPRRATVLAQAERLFERTAGVPARRNPGGTYADRAIFFEDCQGDAQPLELPRTWQERLTAGLAPVLDVGLAIGEASRAAYRAVAADVLREADRPLGYLEFADLMRAEQERLSARLAPVRALTERIHALVRDHTAGAVARIPPDDLAAVATAAGSWAFASPDVLLSGDGTGAIVLGEIHPYVFAWGLQGEFAPEPGRLTAEAAELAAVWGGPDRLGVVLHRRRHKGLLSERFPGTWIEVTGRAGHGSRRVAVADLTVRLRGDEPELAGPAGPLTLYTGEDDHPHLRVFAPAQVEFPRIRLGAATPRVVVGDVVVQRARWHPPGAELAPLTEAGPSQVLAAAAALRERLGLPRHLFVLSPTEVKPIYVDLTSPLAVDQLRRLAAAGPVTLTEMLPEPGDLWLRRSSGAFTSELRLAMVREPLMSERGERTIGHVSRERGSSPEGEEAS